jgi:hypothetical protein
MNNAISRISQIPVQDFFPAELQSKVEKWNSELHKLAGRQAEVPRGRRALAEKVATGTITGPAAWKERTRLAGEEPAVLVDARGHIAEKDPLEGPFKAAYGKQADKCAAAAEERKAGILDKVSDVLTLHAAAEAVRVDGEYQTLTNLAREYRKRSNLGFRGDHETRQWLTDCAMRLKTFFG